MNIILIFFAISFVVIVISIALEKILNCPILVAAIIFSIILLIAIILLNNILLVASVFFAILAFIVATITCIICRFRRHHKCNDKIDSEENLNSQLIEAIANISTNLNTANNNSNVSCCCRRRR